MPAFTIPNSGATAIAAQAMPDSGDFEAIVAGFVRTGVISGCAVTAQGTPNMTVAVASGVAMVAGVYATVAAGNVTITTAHGTLPRFDLVVASSAGTKSVTAGTAAANPVFPAIPASSVLLAAVYVPAADTAVNADQITDKRVMLATGLWTAFNVSDYGAVGDGVTDDTVAIQAAITACGIDGGGIVFFPSGIYNCATTTTVTGLTWVLSISHSNITLLGPGASIRTAVAGTELFLISPTPATWGTSLPTGAAVYAMGAVVAGASSVTLTTAAQASNFVAGDYCFLRTGQTVPGLTTQPDSEVNKVVSADAGTGIIRLAWPTVKAYAQEYFISGTTGLTSTAVTANPAAFGIAKITATTLSNITFRDLDLQATYNVVVSSCAIVGFAMENCTGVVGAGVTSMGDYRFGRLVHNRFHHTGTGAWSYIFTSATGTSDVLIEGNGSTAERVVYYHVHEGSANIRIVNNVVASSASATAASENAVSITGRAYNVAVEGNTFNVPGVGVAIAVSDDCVGGGRITGNTITGGALFGIDVLAPNWTVRDNNNPYGSNQYGAALLPSIREQLSGWVTVASPTTPIGTIPGRSYVLTGYVFVHTAFNSDGYDLIHVGTTADPALFVNGVDASSTGHNAPAASTGMGYQAADTVVAGRYFAGGSAPTTGKALVVIEYTRTQNLP